MRDTCSKVQLILLATVVSGRSVNKRISLRSASKGVYLILVRRIGTKSENRFALRTESRVFSNDFILKLRPEIRPSDRGSFSTAKAGEVRAS